MSASLTFINAASKMVRMPECDDVNMSNSNTHAVLTALGLSPNFDGSIPEHPELLPMPVAEFQKTLELFLSSDIASLVDTGKPAKLLSTEAGRCQVIDCGRRDGYITMRVQRMLDVTKKAALMGATACYFS